MMTLQIKKVTPNEVALLLSFVKQLGEYEKASASIEVTEERLYDVLFSEESKVEAIIGYLDNEPVSFAIYFYNYSSYLGKLGIYVEDLFVKPNIRAQGIGRKMMAYLAKLTQECGGSRLEFSVLNWNTPAMEFYERIGAKPKDYCRVYRIADEALTNLANTG